MQVARQKIADLLEKTIGLNVRSIGDSTLQRALGTRMKALAIDEFSTYFDKLSVSFMELRRLVEEVVVPETWFFRDQEPFVFLTDYILKSKKDLSKDIFRILSLPCSTGEEPYSVAMTMLKAGLKPSDFYIDAVDVSERVLAFARKGVYRQNSFRTDDLTFRDEYFFKVGDEFAIKRIIREKVRFLQGNILQHGFLESLGRYDVVFCRNVLIYFNKESQKQAIESLYNLLVPEGLLFTGHSEASLFMETRFAPVPHSKSFAFYKKRVEQFKTMQHDPFKRNSWTGKGRMASPFSISRATPPPVAPSFVSPGNQENNEYEVVRQLADEGKLEEAVVRCEKFLRLNTPSARWYCLLGIIRDSQGNQADAMKLLRKAVYLDPDHVESLIQLSLLAERAGDFERAANYKRRARKLREGGK